MEKKSILKSLEESLCCETTELKEKYIDKLLSFIHEYEEDDLIIDIQYTYQDRYAWITDILDNGDLITTEDSSPDLKSVYDMDIYELQLLLLEIARKIK